MRQLQWRLKDHWNPHGGQPGCSDPSVAGVRGSGSLVTPGGLVGVWCSFPVPSPVRVVV